MNNIWIWVIVIIIVLGGGYWLMQGGMMPAATSTTPQATETGTMPSSTGDVVTPSMEGDTVAANPSAPMTATITYSGSGFSPQEVTIKKSGAVTWVNSSGGKKMWVASATHPEHVVYDNTNRTTHCAAGYTGAAPFDQCAGEDGNYSFTFNKVGTWGFHDHINSQAWGRVTVVE